jgi:putative tryptophan/tyrosine transport system substrate-binding protein
VTNLNVEIGPKRLEVLHVLLPTATDFAVLVDPTGPALAEPFLRAVQAAARSLGLRLHVLHASTEREFDSVFARMVQLKAAALIIGPTTFFVGRGEQLATLAIRYKVPAIYQYRPFAVAGGLMSYGSDETEYYSHSPGGRNTMVMAFLIAWSISSAVMRTIILLVTKPLSLATTDRAAAEILSGTSAIM